MLNPLSKTPFLLLLLPLLVGIVLQYYLQIYVWSILFFLIGGMGMLYSFFIHPSREYSLRWIFGCGLALFLIGVGILTTFVGQSHSQFVFADEWTAYKAVVESPPQEKDNSLAYSIYLPHEDKHLIAYLALDTTTNKMQLGDEILFYGKVNRFENRKTQTVTFDYVQYMHDKGLAGTVYIASDKWKRVGEHFTAKTYALSIREKILSYYQTLDLDADSYSVLAALTLGYKDSLSDDLVQSFRNTGTVHVLSISGLHVGLIYAFLLFFFQCIRRENRFYILKPILIISFLWLYAFVSGLSPSVIRACMMLTVFCIGDLLNRKSYSLHALYISAFFILLFSPLSLFDISFQLSFSSVFSILYVYPYLRKTMKVKNSVGRYIWSLFCLSLVAQLGAFPLCLYYFGYFPVYFFVANILVVPLVSLVIYSSPLILIVVLCSFISDTLSLIINNVISFYFRTLINLLAIAVQMIERLPFATIGNISISFSELVLLLFFLMGMIYYVIHKSRKALIVGLFTISILFINQCIHIY